MALLKDKRLAELTTEKTSVKFAVGDIYYGKVKKIMPGLNAAFVNVGYEKDAFLHYLDLSPQFNSLNSYMKQCIARKGMPVSKLKLEPEIDKNGKIADVLKVGQYVAVQVAKEPISTKGPRLTSELSIAGRHLVLMPFAEKVSVSFLSLITKNVKETLTNVSDEQFAEWVSNEIKENFMEERLRPFFGNAIFERGFVFDLDYAADVPPEYPFTEENALKIAKFIALIKDWQLLNQVKNKEMNAQLDYLNRYAI